METLSKLYAEQNADDELRAEYAEELKILQEKIDALGTVVPGSRKHTHLNDMVARRNGLKRLIDGIERATVYRKARVELLLQRRASAESTLRKLEADIGPGGKFERELAEIDAERDRVLARLEEHKTLRIPSARQQLAEIEGEIDGE